MGDWRDFWRRRVSWTERMAAGASGIFTRLVRETLLFLVLLPQVAILLIETYIRMFEGTPN